MEPTRTPTEAHARAALQPASRLVPERARQSAAPLSSIIQRTMTNPGSLTRADAVALQRTIGNAAVSQLAARAARRENRTGLAAQLKAGIENLSGLALDDVRVHYNSDKPATVQALAYAQAPEIHIAPGQEQHLPHEAWHVVQQKQGRVKPTLQLKGVAINDDGALENEADVMGDRATSRQVSQLIAAEPVARTSDVGQRRLIPPDVSGAATLGKQHSAASTDLVAKGPAKVWAYSVNVNARMDDRNAAIAAIRTEYASMGKGFGSEFLSADNVRKYITNNLKFAVIVYDILREKNAIPLDNYIKEDEQKRAFVNQEPDKKKRIPVTKKSNKATGGESDMKSDKKSDKNNNAMLDEKVDQSKKKLNIDLRDGGNLDLLRDSKQIIPLADPVRVRVAALYGQDQVTGNLAITIEFSEGMKGYISRVEDTGANNTDAALQDRPNFAGEYPKDDKKPYKDFAKKTIADAKGVALSVSGEEVKRLPSFSAIHHRQTNESAATQIGRLGSAGRRVDLEAGLDAITKVVAEGGRFAPVGALGPAIRNDSLFFAATEDEKGSKYRAVEFRVLWNHWVDSFKGAYGVTNAEIAKKLRDPKTKWANDLGAIPAQTGYHFNLDTNARH